MTQKELSSKNVGINIVFSCFMYSDKKKYENILIYGAIDSLLIDTNFGAYGFKCKFKHKYFSEVNFILKNEDTKNLIGYDIKEIDFSK